jgi:acyl-CoA hydrolase
LRRIVAEVAHRAHQFAVAVVGGVRADQSAFAGRQPGHLDSDFNRLGAAAAKHHAFDAIVVQAGESLGEGDDALVQVTAMSVQGGLLLGHGLDDRLVGMPDDRDIVVHVNVAPAVTIEKIGALTTDDLERLVVKEFCTGTEGLVPAAL